MKRYSPSSTETWTQCPLKRHLRSTGWQPRRMGKRELGGILGTAFAQGVGAYNATRQTGATPDPALCVAVAVQSARQELRTLLERGHTIGDHDRAQAEAIEPRVQRAITRYIAADPIPPAWTVLDVERILPAWGNCRIDLGLDTPQGPVVLDYKCKLQLDQKWLGKEVERYRLSEQRFHYSAAYGDYLGRPVVAFYICLVILEPSFRTHLLPFVNAPDELAMWLQARETTWRLMEMEERGEIGVGISGKHMDEFGPCEFTGACFGSRLDPQLMSNDYITQTEAA